MPKGVRVKLEVLERIHEKVLAGASASAACAEEGVNVSTYFNRRRELRARKKAQRRLQSEPNAIPLDTIPGLTQESKIMVVIGTPSQVAEVLRGIK